MTHRRETTSANRAPSFLRTRPALFCARCNSARIFIPILSPRMHAYAYFRARKSREDVVDSKDTQSPNRSPLIVAPDSEILYFFFLHMFDRTTCK